jgi:hypothetical protein
MQELTQETMLYYFDIKTREYVNQGLSYKHPSTGTHFMPNFATTLPYFKPTKPKHAVIFENDEWVEKIDIRGTRYFTPDGVYHKITKIGEELPANYLLKPPDLRSFGEIKKYANWKIARLYSDSLRLYVGTSDEIVTYQIRADASKAYNSGDASNHQLIMLQDEADVLGITVSELATQCLEEYGQCLMIMGKLSGFKTKFKALAVAGTTKEAVKKVVEDSKKDLEVNLRYR